MAHMMKKADFLALVEEHKGKGLLIKTFRGSVYLYADNVMVSELYCASNMKESGIISGMNQGAKYRGWMK